MRAVHSFVLLISYSWDKDISVYIIAAVLIFAIFRVIRSRIIIPVQAYDTLLCGELPFLLRSLDPFGQHTLTPLRMLAHLGERIDSTSQCQLLTNVLW